MSTPIPGTYSNGPTSMAPISCWRWRGLDVAHAVALDPSCFGRAFCVRELVALAAQRGPRRDGEPFGAWLARMHRGRHASDVLRAAGELDVADPFGQARDEFERCATELDALTRDLAPLVA